MKILKEIDVIEIIGLSHTTLYRLMKAKRFPLPIRLSPNRVGWPEGVIYQWIEDRQKNVQKLIKQGGI